MKAHSKVFVSFLADPGSGYWVGEKGDGDFTLHVKVPVASDTAFEYWIVGVDDRRPTQPASAGTGTSSSTDSGSTTPSTPVDSGSATPQLPVDSGTDTPSGA